MKVNLVVTQGVHAGKKIPVSAAADFVIGRDAQCQLRPASPSISKQHCAISIRGTEVYVRDCGSTNGTFVNGEQVAGDYLVTHGATLRVGPLEFTLSIEAAIAAPASVTETVTAKAATTDTVVAKPLTAAAAKGASDTSVDADDPEQLAALMLGFDDGSGGTPTVENFNPDSTTVMEMPALGAAAKPGTPAPKKEEKKVHGDSSSAAAEALSKYMRRPRT